MIEEDLGNLSLFASAQGLREQVLTAIRRARKDRLIGRWFVASAIASVLLAGLTLRLVDSDPTPEPPSTAERDAVLLAELQALPDEIRLPRSLFRPPSQFPEEESPWVR